MIILLQSVTIQFFFDIFRITKCGKVILIQSVTDCYYKVHQVLQSVTVITKCDVTTFPDFSQKLIKGFTHFS